MNTEDLFSIIGKLYTDLYGSQKIIELLQKQIQDKDKEIVDLRKKLITENDRE